LGFGIVCGRAAVHCSRKRPLLSEMGHSRRFGDVRGMSA
jgi:hypothetical protein